MGQPVAVVQKQSSRPGVVRFEANRSFTGMGHDSFRSRDDALRAANAIGDDALQRQAGGAVVPDSFTHGTSAERVKWFKTGFETGSVKACDTFAARDI